MNFGAAHEALPLSARLARSVLSRQTFQTCVIRRRARQQVFQPGIPVNDRTQLNRLRYFHAAVSGFEFVERLLDEAMLTTQLMRPFRQRVP